ncbi:UGSC family (seleno)protein [Actinophytocola oryzae]|uniref:UGSC-like domain-containing protein n=1 Tax=Actinophytocola oryzae TaxID=502181 RepID=A0A4R7W1D6_9PSEU|nr:hypothetical protein [Actinophytocola oryzae]TDV56356.1 hypothetical protein CLV71_102423 [Actinophytocola oryzae]
MATQVVDPRIPAPARPASLAPRRADLTGARILLFDNGKLAPDYGPYGAIFDVVEAALGGVEVRRHTDDLLRGTGERLREVARWVRDQDVAGVVFALGDWGVSQPTAIVASELERLGVPASVVTTEIGGRQALAAAKRLAPGLPVTTLTSLRSATYDEIAAETRTVLDDIIGGLTGDADALRKRFEARAIAAPAPADASGLVDLRGADPSAEFTDLMRESLLGDGFPLVAPTREKVDAFLAAAGKGADDAVWPAIAPRDTEVTAREVAAVAVAAGCRPRWAPVVFAAYEAMAAPEFRLFQAAITTHPGGTLVLVSGPDHERYGFAADRGSLGPGFEANATTGRAVALGYSFLLGAIPGGADLTAQGSPAEFSYCCAENLAESPWPGLHADLGHPDATTVTVLKCEGPHNILDQQSSDPGLLLGTVASSMATLGSNAAYVAGAETVLMLNPEHARLLASAGWSRRDVREFLFDAARNPREDLRGRGLAPIWPAWFDAADRVPVFPDPVSLLVAVVGGSGPASQVAIPWGYSRAITRTIPS